MNLPSFMIVISIILLVALALGLISIIIINNHNSQTESKQRYWYITFYLLISKEKQNDFRNEGVLGESFDKYITQLTYNEIKSKLENFGFVLQEGSHNIFEYTTKKDVLVIAYIESYANLNNGLEFIRSLDEAD